MSDLEPYLQSDHVVKITRPQVFRPYDFYYIFIISQLWLTYHPRSTVILLDTGTPGTSREIFSEDADGETRTRGVASSSLTIGILTESFSAGTRSSCVQ